MFKPFQIMLDQLGWVQNGCKFRVSPDNALCGRSAGVLIAISALHLGFCELHAPPVT